MFLSLSLNVEAQYYTFGTQRTSGTGSPNLAYNSGTGLFQYTDSAGTTDDYTDLPLAGNAVSLITSSTGWTASITVNLSARSMTSNSTEAPRVVVGLNLNDNNTNYSASFQLAQFNETGGTGSSYFPNDSYGTAVSMSAQNNGVNLATTPLGASATYNGQSYQKFSGGTSNSYSTQSISAASGVLTLSYNASTQIVTGYYNGAPVGSYSTAAWGSNQSLLISVLGYSGEGVAVTTGTATATNFYVDPFSGTLTGTAYLNDSPWFGYYTTNSYPLIYQYYLGYEYVFPTNGGVYLYDYGSGHFWYTQSSYFPYLYDFSLNAFLYYYQGNTPHRHFYNFGTGQLITE